MDENNTVTSRLIYLISLTMVNTVNILDKIIFTSQLSKLFYGVLS